MADINVSGRMVVKTLKKQFKEAYGATLRVYIGKSTRLADESATLSSIRDKSAKGGSGELKISGNMKVGNFEDKFKEAFGIQVQVATPDDSRLSSNDITISAAGREK